MKKSAFTLIELLVVIVVIAILAGIALPVFGKVQVNAKLINDLSNLRQIGIGLRSYFNDHEDTMISGSGTWVLKDSPLYDYCGKSYAVWKSKFDPRTTPGKDYVSFSFNEKILAPGGGASTDSDKWSGNISMAKASPSKLVMAAQNFTGKFDGGNEAWGGDSNTSESVKALPLKGGAMDSKGISKKISVLFLDNHVENALIGTFKWTDSDKNSWLLWDPMQTEAK